jgi:hypothetical protein
MKIFVLTSNKYKFLLDGFSHQFNKYWDNSLDVNVLCFDKPEIELPNNFKIESLGKQPSKQNWSGPLIDYFSNFKDDRFFLCFEDHYLVKPVDQNLFNIANTFMDDNENIEKIWLLCKPTIKNESYSNKFYKWKRNSGCLIPSSLLPSIWRTKYFLELLNHNKTCHQFETENKNTIGNRLVIYPKEWPIFPSLDAMRHGDFNNKIFQNFNRNKSASPQVWHQDLNQEDIDTLKRMRTKKVELYG